jgi:very-short-patch-repair endonuclease
MSAEKVALLREMRRESTPAEAAFWELVRAGRHEGLRFRREHPIGPYIVDFFCHAKALVVEIDGEIHDVAAVKKNDVERQAALEAEGYRVIRFTNEEVLQQKEAILKRL